MSAKLSITKVRSEINRTQRQKRTLEALGLRKIGQTVVHEKNATIIGMVKKVEHLISVKEL